MSIIVNLIDLQTITLIVEDDSILTEENTLEYHLVPLSGTGRLVPLSGPGRLVPLSGPGRLVPLSGPGRLVPLSCPSPLVATQRITSPDYITYNSKLDWMRDGYATAVLGNFLFVGGGYDPADGEKIQTTFPNIRPPLTVRGGLFKFVQVSCSCWC